VDRRDAERRPSDIAAVPLHVLDSIGQRLQTLGKTIGVYRLTRLQSGWKESHVTGSQVIVVVATTISSCHAPTMMFCGVGLIDASAPVGGMYVAIYASIAAFVAAVQSVRWRDVVVTTYPTKTQEPLI
jgi:hypothetical protein